MSHCVSDTPVTMVTIKLGFYVTSRNGLVGSMETKQQSDLIRYSVGARMGGFKNVTFYM